MRASARHVRLTLEADVRLYLVNVGFVPEAAIAGRLRIEARKIWPLPLLPSGQDVFLEVEQRHIIVVQRLVARTGELPHRTAQAFRLRSVRHHPPRHLRGDRRIAKDVGQGRRDDLHGSRLPVVEAPTKGTQRVVSP